MTLSGRHAPFYLAVAVGAVALALGLWALPQLAFPIATNAFFVTYLGLELKRLPTLSADYLRKHAASNDLPVTVIFLVTLAAVASAFVALFVLLNADQRSGVIAAMLTLIAVPLGWFTIHMMAAIHYAHVYWQPRDATDQLEGGLDFPGTAEPRGTDFVYFAFVIGMTAQTSDVQITTQRMRSINIVHAIVSFFFNTVLVAAAVNAAVALGN
ncbi:MAG TPA: DUF1345 domain-containing protein [Mycoplana sp.]|nr:DUF1345 domain-containing protein [Mycoplana sp.]